MLDNLTKRLAGIFQSLHRKGRLTEADVNEMLREVRVALLEADVNFQVAKAFMQRVRDKAVGEELYGSLTADQTLIRIVRDELVTLLGGESVGFRWSSSPPTVILLAGLQGSGKTTTAAKLCLWLKRNGRKPMMAACDVQRPAAIHQLEVLGEQVDVPVFSDRNPGADPVQIAKAALDRAKHLFLDVLVVDTAGRLSIDEPLMDELARINRAVSPSERLLVLDSTTGQEAVQVAEAFHKRLELTGAIFTKLDGDARGGAVLSVREATGVPVRFVGLGEATDALDLFHPDRMAQRILGMGDVLGIIERAEQVIKVEEAKAMESKMRSGSMDFNDFLAKMQMVRRMGPLKNLVKMMPGLSAALPEEALDQVDESKMDRLQAIVLSMTPHERSHPDIINGSRRKRIAKGSGTSVEEVNRLVEQLFEMRRSIKQVVKLEKRFKNKRRR